VKGLPPVCVWIRRECFRYAKSVWKSRGQKLAGSLLTTAFPHSFTPYPHSAGSTKELTEGSFNNCYFLSIKTSKEPLSVYLFLDSNCPKVGVQLTP
jgi:hypothetical protein